EPCFALPVVEDDAVLARLQDEVEVAPVDRLLGPPAVYDAPFLAHHRDARPVDCPWDAVEVGLDERRPRGVQSSRGTSSARCSGIRDHGATSTTVQIAPWPALARTWRRPSRRRTSSSAPSGRTSSS